MKKNYKEVTKVIKQLIMAIEIGEDVADICNAYEKDVDDLLKEMEKAKKAGKKLLKELKDIKHLSEFSTVKSLNEFSKVKSVKNLNKPKSIKEYSTVKNLKINKKNERAK